MVANMERLSVEELVEKLQQRKDELRKKYGVKEFGIFGSYLRGEQAEGSDVDILVEFKQNAKISLLTFVELENYLSDLLSLKVDLVEKAALKPALGKRILREVVYL